MNSSVKSLIGWWIVLGREQPDPFMKFFVFYMCLDAWMTAESGRDRDLDKLIWLIDTGNPLRKHWDDVKGEPQVQSCLNGLQMIGEVSDMRPGMQGRRPRQLNNPADFEQVVRFIYQIRCNLFHGAKSPADPNDIKLVDWSAKILERWIEHTSTSALQTP